MISVCLLTLAGLVLLIASPMLLLLGGWGGADSGSVGRGVLTVLGFPWLVFLASAGVARALVVRRYAVLSCLPACIPLFAELWVYRGMR